MGMPKELGNAHMTHYLFNPASPLSMVDLSHCRRPVRENTSVDRCDEVRVLVIMCCWVRRRY